MNHRPPHFLQNNRWYFVTAHTYTNANLFRRDNYKDVWLSTLIDLTEKFSIELMAWVLLENHYHFLIYLKSAQVLPTFVKQLYGLSSYKINKIEDSFGRAIWYSYWDRCIRDEKDFWTKFNYIHNNPIKHGYVGALDKWAYSSYKDWVNKKGQDWMVDVFQSYPVLVYSFEGGEIT